jgi:hypothetical protein
MPKKTLLRQKILLKNWFLLKLPSLMPASQMSFLIITEIVCAMSLFTSTTEANAETYGLPTYGKNNLQHNFGGLKLHHHC